MATKFCVFCSDIRVEENREDDESSVRTSNHSQVLKSFIVWIQRHFGIPVRSSEFIRRKRRNDDNDTPLKMEPCERCLDIVKSFNDMYKELKCLELEIQLQMNILMDIMEKAGKEGPRQRPRMKALGKREFRKLTLERNEWIEECSDKLLVRGFPKIKLENIDASPIRGASFAPIKTEPAAAPAVQSVMSVHDKIKVNGFARKLTKSVPSTNIKIESPSLHFPSSTDDDDNIDFDPCQDDDVDFEIDNDPMDIHAVNDTISLSFNDQHSTGVPQNDKLKIKRFPKKAKKRRDTLYSCELCEESFDNYDLYVIHGKSTSHQDRQKQSSEPESTKFVLPNCTCDECGTVVQGRLNLKRHQNKHVKNSIPCKLCKDSWYLRRDNLLRHMQSEHNLAKRGPNMTKKPKPFRCDLCGQRFSKNAYRTRHVMIVHEGRRDFKCPLSGCEAEFFRKDVMQRHMRTVHNETN